MTKERQFFQTQADACLCGETVLARSMYRKDILCSHRIAVWYELNPVNMSHPWADGRPPVLGPVIGGLPFLEMEWVDCPVGCLFVQRAVNDPANADRRWDIERLVKKIAKQAHASPKREEIRAFVEANYNDDCYELALGESRSFWDVHEAGVCIFR
jgi:hypothetical protein